MRAYSTGRPTTSSRRLIRGLVAFVLLAATGLAGTGQHTIKAGETLSGIASANGTTVAALVAANGISNPNLIVAGRTLTIPGAHPTTHTVTAGETIASISRRYGTTVSALASANHLSNPNLVRIGQQLTIPAGGSSSSSGGPRTHVVLPGESLAGIAAQFGVSAASVAAANGILDMNRIYVGTRLFIDPTGVAVAAPTGGGTYTVKVGDTLGSIARQFGTTVDALAKANGISNPNLVRIGVSLDLAGGSSSIQCPVPGASFFNDWGFPRSGGRFHEGNDLFAPRDTPVAAPVSGTVSYVNGSLGGLEFKLYGDNGDLYLGSHLDKVGHSGHVSAGTTVGYVGNSGDAAGGRTHLHFELHPGNGPAVNPYPTLVAACR